MRTPSENKADMGGLWCPYCEKYAARWDGHELRCAACGHIAQIDYGQVVEAYGPAKAQRMWQKRRAGRETKQMTLGLEAA